MRITLGWYPQMQHCGIEKLHQMDVNRSFLNEDLEEEIYM